MKKTVLSILAAIFTFAASQDIQAQTTERKQIHLSEEEELLVNSNNDFAFNLFRAAQNDESQILSPLSITYALGMLNNGATGETQQEINKTLGFGDAGADAVNAFCKKMLRKAPSLDEGTDVLIGNTIYTNKGYTLRSGFVKKAKKYYNAHPESRDFHDGKTLDIINQWASDHTNKMIQQVLDERSFNPDAVSYLLNAIYFKGTWTNRFDSRWTKEEPFNDKEKVMMMQQNAKLYYNDNDIYQSVQLPYGNEAYSMTVMLPHKGKTVDDILNNLNAERWRENKRQMSEQTVDLKLPRIETCTDLELNEIMQSLGIQKAFTNAAEFDKFCKIPTSIGLIKQVARIKLDEKGTEAAAVTVILQKLGSAANSPLPIEFHANRTFLYVISEQSTGAIFFIGKFTGN